MIALVIVFTAIICVGCGPGDLSVRIQTERAVSHANVTVRYVRGEDVSQMIERISLNAQGEGQLDLRDDVSAVSVSFSMSQPRATDRASDFGLTTLELLNGGDIIDASTGILPSVLFQEDS